MPAAPRASDLDRGIALKVRQRRILVGLTQQQLADIIGVTYQQAHKYETGINRISAGRLFTIAQALHIEPAWFFESLGAITPPKTDRARQLVEINKVLISLPPSKRSIACKLIRSLAGMDVEGTAQLEVGEP